MERSDKRFAAAPVKVIEFDTLVKLPEANLIVWAAETDLLRLLNVVFPVMVCPVGPPKTTVLVPGVKVPLFDQLPFSVSVLDESVKVLPEPIKTPPATFIGPENPARFHATVPAPEAPTEREPFTVSVLDPVPEKDASPDELSKLRLP